MSPAPPPYRLANDESVDDGARCSVCGKTKTDGARRQVQNWHKCRVCGAAYCPSHTTRLARPGWSSNRGAFDQSRICTCGGLTHPLE